MSEFNRNYSTIDSTSSLNSYITKVFVNMGVGLAITTVVSFGLYMMLMSGSSLAYALYANPWISFIFLAAELGLAIALGTGLSRFSTGTCRALFYGYSALTGITFAVLPMAYGLGTFFTAFLFAAVLFGCCAVIGHTTNIDLTRFSGMLFGALLALVIMTVISMFIPALRQNLFIGYIGLLIFLVYTAFDMQKIKQFYYGVGEGTLKENLAVYAAFQLYLDFINILIYVLRILGSRNSRD